MRWTEQEKAIALDPQLSTREAAEQVGRTLSAVAEIRRRSADIRNSQQQQQGKRAEP